MHTKLIISVISSGVNPGISVIDDLVSSSSANTSFRQVLFSGIGLYSSLFMSSSFSEFIVSLLHKNKMFLRFLPVIELQSFLQMDSNVLIADFEVFST